jgi:hypothetical protein
LAIILNFGRVFSPKLWRAGNTTFGSRFPRKAPITPEQYSAKQTLLMSIGFMVSQAKIRKPYYEFQRPCSSFNYSSEF